MNNLVLTMINGEPTVTSRQVAEDFGKEHKNILRDIENIIGGLVNSEHTHKMFNEVQYVHPQNKQAYNEFIMNRDGWTLLAMGFTGSKAMQWKLKYIEAFNAMEKQLSTPQLPQTYLEALEALVTSTKALAAAESTVSLLMHTDKTYTATEIAKELGFRSAQRFNDWLRTRSIIFDVNGTTVLRSTYADRGYYSIKQCIPESGNVVYNSKWTQEGRRFLVNLRNQG